MFFTISAWNIIVFPMSLLILTSVAEEMNSYNPRPGRDLAPPSILLPDDGSSNSLIAANSWTADESSNGQLSQIPEYSIEGQGLGQLLVGETDGCQPQSNQNRRRTRRRQVCPAPLLKATGQDTRQDTGQNSAIWPTKFWPDDLPTAKIPPRPSVKADLEKCDHEKYNTPVCDGGEDSLPNPASSTSEWTLPNCIPCTWSPSNSLPGALILRSGGGGGKRRKKKKTEYLILIFRGNSNALAQGMCWYRSYMVLSCCPGSRKSPVENISSFSQTLLPIQSYRS